MDTHPYTRALWTLFPGHLHCRLEARRISSILSADGLHLRLRGWLAHRQVQVSHRAAIPRRTGRDGGEEFW